MAEQRESSSTPHQNNTASQPLSSFLQRISDDIDNCLPESTASCEVMLSRTSQLTSVDFKRGEYVNLIQEFGTINYKETTLLLQHFKQKCSSLLEASQAPKFTPESLKTVLQDSAHMVLDYTYLDETLLAEAEFPPENATDRINAIIEQLDKICQVANECFENKLVLETLGEDLVECIHWRKGALLYMYCHTLESNNRINNPAKYKQCLEEGVGHLENMLSTRQPTAVPNSVDAEDTLQLFSQGVYSDTHLLAIMYAAEMCYWHQQAVDKNLFPCDAPVSPATGDNKVFSAKTQGLEYLNRYLAAVKGPLKGQEWNTSRAEEIMKYFQNH